METISVRTNANFEFVDITPKVSSVVSKSGVKEGVCIVFIPHTTAGVTINENADPDVKRDMLVSLDKLVPLSWGYHHMEGNSAAHIKASMMGFSEHILVSGGKLVLGTWQDIYFCEFDGPRSRKAHIQVLSS